MLGPCPTGASRCLARVFLRRLRHKSFSWAGQSTGGADPGMAAALAVAALLPAACQLLQVGL